MKGDYNEMEEKKVVRKRKNKKRIYVVVIIILLLVAAGVSFAVWNSYFRNNEEQQQEEKGDNNIVEAKTEKDGKGESGEKVEKNDSEELEREEEKEEVMTYEGSNPNNAEALTGVVTFAGASDDMLVIRMSIDQYVVSGSCELGLYKNGAMVYSDTAAISAAASTATCEGFNVPVSSIGSGQYQIVINVKSGDKTGTIKGEVGI